jgi:hypothetical protein
MPNAPQLIVTITLAVIVILALVAAIRYGVRHRTAQYVVLLCGGALAAVNEPFDDVLGGVIHPQAGGWTAFTLYDRPIPIWVVLAYSLYFGAVPLLVSMMLRTADQPRRRFWQLIPLSFAANLLIEIPIMKSHMYTYYGTQPFTVLGVFPVQWLVINGAGAVAIVVALHRFGDRLQGTCSLWLAVVPLAAAETAAVVVGGPFFSVFSTAADDSWKRVASAITIIVGVTTLHLISKALPRRRFDRAAGVTL